MSSRWTINILLQSASHRIAFVIPLMLSPLLFHRAIFIYPLLSRLSLLRVFDDLCDLIDTIASVRIPN
jgi:hypothetical protein